MYYHRRNKYWNQKAIVDWITFDSVKEATFYKQLKILEKADKIKNLELQPVYILQDSFKYKWKTIRAIKYIADFSYIDIDKNTQVIIDVKWYKNEVYNLKKKLFLKKIAEHKDVIFKEI